MDQDFERGKKHIIKGMEDILALIEPFLELLQGFKMMKIWEIAGVDKNHFGDLDEYEEYKLIIESWLSDFKKAETREDVKKTLDEAREFFRRLR
jgi:hypothetical protein